MVWVWMLSELGLSIRVVRQWVKPVLGMFLPPSWPLKILVLEVGGQAGPDGTDGSLG